MDYMNDKELLRLLKADPERGLAQTVGQYGAYVYKIAFTRLGEVCSKEDIEEAVSDIFLAFFEEGRKRGFDVRSVGGFLTVIAKRHCIDVFRRESRREKSASLDELENTLSENAAPDTELIEAIKQLGEPDRYIFIRKYWFGQSNADIARELGMKPGTLNTRISRGLDKLKKILEGKV